MSSAESCEDIELGFAIPVSSSESLLHDNPAWNDWDGGVLGGSPSLLLPFTDEDKEKLKCSRCSKLLSFLLQIYAPKDVSESCFHRTVYVFVCRNDPFCLETGRGVQVLRAQISRTNSFYSYEPKNSIMKGFAQDIPLGKAFEKRFELVVEEEGVDETQKKESSLTPIQELAAIKGNFMIEETADDKIDQAEFDMIAAQGKMSMLQLLQNKDEEFHKFQETIRHEPSQIVRYNVGPSGSPLWVSAEKKPTDVPVCPLCNSKRSFEFQIMPQTLSLIEETTIGNMHRSIYASEITNNQTGAR